MAALLLTACTSKSNQTTTLPDSTTTAVDPSTSTTRAAEDEKLVVWVDEARAPVVEVAAEAFEAATGTTVEIEARPFFEIRGAATEAIPAGQGPDLFIDSNEGTGALVEAGLIAPLDLGRRESEFLSVAIDAFSYEGDVYALHFVIEAVGLFFNQDLVREPPADFATLRAVCDDLGFPTTDGVPCLAIPAGEPLHQFPFVAGFGGLRQVGPDLNPEDEAEAIANGWQ